MFSSQFVRGIASPKRGTAFPGTQLKPQNRNPSLLVHGRDGGLNLQDLEDEHMCWFSTERAEKVDEASAGQRLAIKKMPWHANWAVRETDLETSRPCPVCLTDQTRVLFRFAEKQAVSLKFGSEAEAVFRMLKRPRRDVFEFTDGRELTLNDLPAGVIFDVLVVPGSEQLSEVLNTESNENNEEDKRETESLFARLMAHF